MRTIYTKFFYWGVLVFIVIGSLDYGIEEFAGKTICNTNADNITKSTRYIKESENTVTDLKTNLMWAKCSLGHYGSTCLKGRAIKMSWDSSIKKAKSSTHANYSDWRLPNIKELSSIANYRCSNPAINSFVFPNTAPRAFWSSTPGAAANGYSQEKQAWAVVFNDGGSARFHTADRYRVRFVRDTTHKNEGQ